jgi:hypothetical protein
MNLEELLEKLDIGEGADIEFKSARVDFPYFGVFVSVN